MPPPPPRMRILLALGVAVPLLSVAGFLLDGATRPGYDWHVHYISQLSNGGRGWLQATNFYLMGLGMLAVSFSWSRGLAPGRASRAAPIGLAVMGLGLLVAGTFATDPANGYPPGVATPGSWSLSANLHGLGAFVMLPGLTTTLWAMAIRFRADAQPGWFGATVAVGILFPVLFVWSSLNGGHGGADLAGAYPGLLQRAAVVPAWLWISAASWRLLRDARASSAVA